MWLAIDDEDATGRAPCSSYGGPVKSVYRGGIGGGAEYRVVFDFFADLGGCPGVRAEAAEAAYFEALTRVEQARRAGDTLTLTGDGVTLAFEFDDDSG